MKKYNTMPTVVTWGDYFQMELAYELRNSSLEDFTRAVDTVKFDIISSYQIFFEKEPIFYEWVESNYNKIKSERDKFSEEEHEEAFHLKILKDYYINLGIINKFSKEEMVWYNSYKEVVAV